MNTVKKIGLGVLVFVLFACEQPFRAGLGKVVDTRPPTISLLSPGAGDFIWGNKLFIGKADDDYILDRVELKVTNYPEIDYLREFVYANLVKKAQSEGEWNYSIDTTKFPDGDLKILIKAVDSANKDVMTDEIVFLVKNEPPAISVTAPYIPHGDKDGEVGGNHLNYGAVDALPVIISFPRQVDRGSILSGNISDQDDIYTDVENGNMFPPQIRLWRVNNMNDPQDTEGFPPGVLPPYEGAGKVGWENFVVNETLFMLGIGNYQFTWNLPPGAGRFYGFEIRAQSKDGRTQFHYPRDFWPNINSDSWDDLSAEGDFKKENRYVLLYVRSPSEVPTVDIYGLEDILGPEGWNGTSYNSISGVNDNMDHPYVNKVTVSKNGPFTLRVKASHTDGINTAEVYWERDDKSARGRFIWDLANEPPAIPGWDNILNVSADRPYSEWGFRDPHSHNGGFYETRNYIFTYNHDGNDRVPVGENYNKQVRGRSKIQKYIPDDIAAWNARKRDGSLPLADVFAADIWEEIDVLDEGVYNIEVYARSSFGTPVTNPFTCSVGLDWTAPEAEINTIDGAYSQDMINNEAVVNGVIRPRMRFSDSRPQDSGLRAAVENYYLRPSSSLFGYEQRYILVGEFDNVEMDKIIAYGAGEARGGWWPPTPAAAGDALEIPGVTVYKHGPIFDSSCMFKTSKIYGEDIGEPDALDGGYWLYVFARDSAFNVGRVTPFKITVKPETDKPVFDFLGSVNPDVTNPNPSHDNHPDADGFWHEGTLRNKFGPNSAIRLRMSDDDSLALGFAGSEHRSSVRVSFIGSTSNAEGEIVPYDESDSAYNMELSDADIKEIFAPLPGVAGDYRPIRERQGEISQTRLLNLLRGKPAYDYLFTAGQKETYTSLPDGIYRVSISVQDYSPSKLVTPEGAPAAEQAVHTVQFWIAVDTANPVINCPEGYPSGYIQASGVELNGYISDRNGPVVLDSFTADIRDNLGNPVTTATATPGEVTRDQRPDSSGFNLWNAYFSAPVSISGTGLSGNYTIILRFKDRFENVSSVMRTYRLDAAAPTVAMRSPMKTFERDLPDVIVASPDGSDGINNKTRLANGVLNFIMSAADNFRVVEARWWLLPANKTITGWDDYVNTAVIDGQNVFAGFKTIELGAAYGRAGNLTDNFNSQTVFIDTAKLADDTEYVLYGMARDEASNSSSVTELQRFYALQEEDRPHFGKAGIFPFTNMDDRPNITPSLGMVVGDAGLTIRGTVFDDDGFYTNNAGTVMEDSVTVWLSRDDSAGQTDPYILTGNSNPGGYTNAVSVTNGIQKTGASNLGLNIKLTDYSEFSTMFDTDCTLHYVIEARDSWFGKYIDEDGTPAAGSDTPVRRLTRRKHFSFTLDKTDPVITLTYPATGQTFGDSAGDNSAAGINFALVGSIQDTHLQKKADGSYYIRFRLGADDLRDIPLGTGAGNGYITSITTTHAANDTVNFAIPADVFVSEIGFFDKGDKAGLEGGHYTLTLIVEDMGGKVGSVALNFIKDTEAPEFSFVNIDEKPLPLIGGVNWWAADTANKQNNMDKRAVELPVINYEHGGGNRPSITGTFSDKVSEVKADTFRYWLDNETTARAGVIDGGANGKMVRWTVDLALSGNVLPDGVHSIRFEIEDTVGNVLASDMYGLRINSIQPVTTLANPPNNVFGGDDSGGVVFSSTGSAVSRNLHEADLIIRYADYMENASYKPWSVELDLENGDFFTFAGAVPPAAGISPEIVETFAWNFDITSEILRNAGKTNMDAVPPPSPRQGRYEIAVVARDRGGLESDEDVWEFIYDTASPSFEFSNLITYPNTAENSGFGADYWLVNDNQGERNILRGSTPKIQGNVSDALSNLAAVDLQIKQYNYADGTWKWYDFTSDNWTASESNSWKELLGSHAPEYSLNFILAGTDAVLTSLPDGLYRVQLRAKDSSIIKDNAAGWAAGNDGNPLYSDYVYFFRESAPPELSHVNEDIRAYSSRNKEGNIINFAVTATDANRFDKLVVKVEKLNGDPMYNADGAISIPGPRLGANSDVWSAQVPLAFVPGTGSGQYPDGSYVIIFTVTDLADGEKTIRRTITLDNTPPIAEIETPRFIGEIREHDENGNLISGSEVIYAHASETIFGGMDTGISGTTDDTGPEGVKGIWYHLGYGTKTAFPDWKDFLGEVPGVAFLGDIDKPGNDEFFDIAARANNNAWFKYEYNSTTPWPIPPAFDPLKSPVDLYNWELAVKAILDDGLKFYTKDNITVKGATYNGAGRRMTIKVEEEKIPANLKKGGLYSLPLWVRVSDGVGNVSYFCRDIWIYPNGDNPTTAIINPSAEVTNEFMPRGGMVSFDGMASDNLAVSSIIYRVKVDNKTGTGYDTTPPDDTDPDTDSNIVELDGATPWNSGGGWAVWDSYGTAGSDIFYGDDTNRIKITKDGWNVIQVMNPSPDFAWSFILNNNDEITKLIPSKGFKHGATINNNMIRVWVEVFVFDEREGSFNVMSLGDSDDNRYPKPFTRVFYLKDSSPVISGLKISKAGSFDYESYTGPGNIRSGRFALQAGLSGSGVDLKQISVKLPGEANANWRTVWEAGVNELTEGVSLGGFTGGSVCTMTYAFDTEIQNAAGGFAAVRNGRWAPVGAWLLPDDTPGGEFTLDIRIRDISDPPGEAIHSFKVTVDNYAPVADSGTTTNTKVAGTDQVFMGRVLDYYGFPNVRQPSYGKIDKIYAWFTKNGKYINLEAGSLSDLSEKLVSMTAYDNPKVTVGTAVSKPAFGNPKTVSYPDPAEQQESRKYVKEISQATAGNLANNITWQPSVKNGEYDITWSFIADTTLMPDGWIDLNYLVIDIAGNASSYKQRMMVMNKYPMITDVRLHTDNRGQGAVFTTHATDNAYTDHKVNTFSSGYLNSGFIAKNRVIGFSVETAGGNYPLNYRLQYVERLSIPLNSGNLKAMANKTGDITLETGTTLSDGGTTVSIAEIENLFTIAKTDTFDWNIWSVLGVHTDNSVNGTHFIFKATENQVAGLNSDSDRVWGYRALETVPVVRLESLENKPTTEFDVVAENFNFSGETFSKIPHAEGSRPDNTLNNSNNAATVGDAGTVFFLIRVWDTVDESPYNASTGEYDRLEGITDDDMLYDAVVIGMNVYLRDTKKPYARLYDLNPYTETAVTGYNIDDEALRETIKEAAAPTAVGANILRGGLYNAGTERAPVKSGYIEPRDGSTALYPHVNYPNDTDNPYLGSLQVRPGGYVSRYGGLANSEDKVSASGTTPDRVSGKVLLRGLAWDDQLIDTISVSIGISGGSSTEKTILQLTDIGGGIREMRPVNNSTAWAYEELHWKTGHTVEWAYLWDTETEPAGRTPGGGPLPSVNIAVTVRDYNSRPNGENNPQRLANDVFLAAGTGGSVAVPPASFHNKVDVQIVPYITGFVRDAKFASTRSRQGWYSFYQDEKNITVNGYNLGDGDSNDEDRIATVTFNSANTADTGSHALTTGYDDGRYTFDIPAEASSGRLDVWIGTPGTGTRAHNHVSSHANKSWNREYNAYTSGSDLWVNKPYAHIWRTKPDVGPDGTPKMYFGNGTATGGSISMTYPAMALQHTGGGNGAGTLHGAWAIYGSEGFYYGTNATGAGRTNLMHQQNEPYSDIDIDYFNEGETVAENATVIASNQADGLATLGINTRMGAGNYTAIGSATTTASSTNRWQNARVRMAALNTNGTNGNAGRAYFSAYDSVDHRLWFTARVGTDRTEYWLDGSGTITDPTGIATTGYAASRSARAGKWSAVDYLLDGTTIRPVIAYYDETNDTIRLLYATGSTNNYQFAAGNWTRRYVLKETDPLRRGSGTYLSMKIDRNDSNRIHLAFYNSNKNAMVYAVGTTTGDFTTYIVDSVVKGGAWTDISLDKDKNPWITYADSARTGNYDGVRIAYMDNNTFKRSLKDTVTGSIIDGWEAITMPAEFTVNDDRLNIEAWPSLGYTGSSTSSPNGGWHAAVGYGGKDTGSVSMFRIGYFYKPSNVPSGIGSWQEAP